MGGFKPKITTRRNYKMAKKSKKYVEALSKVECRARLARPAGGAPAGTCRPRVRPPPQAQVTPGGAWPAGPTWATEPPTPRPRPAVSPPPGALPLRFPSFPSFSPPLSSGRLPPPSAGPGQPQETSLQVWAPTLRAGSFDPVRPAAPSGQVTVAVADQPPSEPRGWYLVLWPIF